MSEVNDGWNVNPPGFRFDIASEVDLIEEIVRMHGYDEVPEQTEIAQSPLQVVTETSVDLERVSDTLIARDYDEAITYSFIDAKSDSAFSGTDSKLVLSNPISSEMSVMRSSLLARSCWPLPPRMCPGSATVYDFLKSENHFTARSMTLVKW